MEQKEFDSTQLTFKVPRPSERKTKLPSLWCVPFPGKVPEKMKPAVLKASLCMARGPDPLKRRWVSEQLHAVMESAKDCLNMSFVISCIKHFGAWSRLELVSK